MISKKEDNTLLIVAVIAVVVAAIGLFVTWGNIFALERVMLGPSGTANVSIASTLTINFTVDKIDWGSGSIPTSCVNCIDFLDTNSTASPDASTLGYWSRDALNGGDVKDGGFIVKNIGNAPVRLGVSSIDAATYLPVTGTGGPSPIFAFSMRQNLANSCTSTVPGMFNAGWINFTGTALPGTNIDVCNSFDNNPASNALEIAIRIGVPVHANAGTKLTTVTGTASAP